MGVSSATVRNDMTVLETEGYLTQPHTSAGRVPTEKGYRHYVDTTGPAPLQAPKTQEVRSFFADAHGELESMLQSTSRLLSKLTSTTAVVVGEHADVARFLSVQLVGHVHGLGDGGGGPQLGRRGQGDLRSARRRQTTTPCPTSPR